MIFSESNHGGFFGDQLARFSETSEQTYTVWCKNAEDHNSNVTICVKLVLQRDLMLGNNILEVDL